MIVSDEQRRESARHVEMLVPQSCPTLCNPIDCSPPGSSVHWGFSRQEYWIGLPFPSPGYLPDSRIKPRSPTLQADSLPSELPGHTYYKCIHSILWDTCFFFFFLEPGKWSQYISAAWKSEKCFLNENLRYSHKRKGIVTGHFSVKMDRTDSVIVKNNPSSLMPQSCTFCTSCMSSAGYQGLSACDSNLVCYPYYLDVRYVEARSERGESLFCLVILTAP